MHKDGVVGTRAEREQLPVAAIANRTSGLSILSIVDALRLRALPNRYVCLRVLNVASYAVDQRLQRMRALGFKESAAIAIGVDVGHRVLLQAQQHESPPIRLSRAAWALRRPRSSR